MPQIGQKWPKFRFFAFGHQKQGCYSLRCINERCACARRTYGWNIFRPKPCHHLHFWKKTTFFSHFSIFSLDFGTGTTRYSSDDHISAILAARRSKFARSSSGWPSGQPGIHDFVFGRHDSELFRGTKKVKIQHNQIGLKFSNLANSVLRTRKSEKLKKKFFFCDVINFFFRFFFKMSICLDGNGPARHDLLLVDDENIRLAFKLGALGADKPPANNT